MTRRDLPPLPRRPALWPLFLIFLVLLGLAVTSPLWAVPVAHWLAGVMFG